MGDDLGWDVELVVVGTGGEGAEVVGVLLGPVGFEAVIAEDDAAEFLAEPGGEFLVVGMGGDVLGFAGVGAEVEEGELDVLDGGFESPFDVFAGRVAPFFAGLAVLFAVAHGEGEVIAAEVGAGADDVAHFADDVVAFFLLGEDVVEGEAVEVAVFFFGEIGSGAAEDGGGEVDEFDPVVGDFSGGEFPLIGRDGDDGAVV